MLHAKSTREAGRRSLAGCGERGCRCSHKAKEAEGKDYSTVRRLKMTEEEEEDDEAGRTAKLRMQFTKVVEEEMKSMPGDDPVLVSDEIEILARLKKMMNEAEKG
eukprot:s5448_g3.t1